MRVYEGRRSDVTTAHSFGRNVLIGPASDDQSILVLNRFRQGLLMTLACGGGDGQREDGQRMGNARLGVSSWRGRISQLAKRLHLAARGRLRRLKPCKLVMCNFFGLFFSIFQVRRTEFRAESYNGIMIYIHNRNPIAG